MKRTTSELLKKLNLEEAAEILSEDTLSTMMMAKISGGYNEEGPGTQDSACPSPVDGKCGCNVYVLCWSNNCTIKISICGVKLNSCPTQDSTCGH